MSCNTNFVRSFVRLLKHSLCRQIGLAAQTGVMIRELRRQVDRILREMISLSSSSSSSGKKTNEPDGAKDNNHIEQNEIMVDGIVQLLIEQRQQ